MKRIIICADGTWNRPEKDLGEDFPTNVLRLSRAIKPVDVKGVPQQVFYDWGIGSYHGSVSGAVTGKGMHKNIMDDYRYIVQNYSHGDEIYLFGFSRGAYTVRALSGLINNCGILRRPDARLIQKAFNFYKRSGFEYSPQGEKAYEFRKAHSHRSNRIKFVGVWDTVGAMGIPISFLGLFDDKDEFYDQKMGRNITTARHALAIDEYREDFQPTIWEPREGMDIKQVWFSGSHADIGGSYKPDKDGSRLSDHALKWMVEEAGKFGLSIEGYLKKQLLGTKILSKIHPSRRSFYRVKAKYYRPIDHGKGEVLIHDSVRLRWERDKSYRPKNLKTYLENYGWGKE